MLRRFYKKISLAIVLVIIQLYAKAQDSLTSTGNSFDDTMRSHNKIYVVMTVCIVILVVLILYLVRIDSKISKRGKEK